MVKLLFNPEKENGKTINSKSSKKKVLDLNPFKEIENEIDETILSKLDLNELTTKDLVGLENTHYILNQWYTTYKKPLLIIGPVGCGKTSLIELYCKENDILLYTVQITDLVKTKKDLLKEITLFIEYSSTSFFIKNQENTLKKLLFFDEYQNGPNDLFGISDIIQLTELKETPPILIISSDSKGSKLNEIKKTCEVYYIGEINHGSILTWINGIYKNIDQVILLEIIKKCKSDKRLLLNILSFLKSSKKNVNIDTFINTFYKDVETNLFEYTTELFLEEQNLNDLFKIYENDGFMIANLVQENYLDFNDNLESIARSADAISAGEIIYSDTYESMRTFLPDAHCLNSICFPSYYSRTPFKKNKCPLRTNCNNNRFNIYLNNKKIFDKLILASNKQLNVEDILYIKKFLTQELIKTKVLKESQEKFLKNLLNCFPINKILNLECMYKYFSEFKDLTGKETKTKNFTLKFKEKLTKLI
jgi:hypothetical protein